MTLPVVGCKGRASSSDPYCITAKHSIGATVTACSQEKKPNEMPAMLPNAKCGNLAVPPETGYIPPSSACTRARMTTMTPAMTQPSKAAVPAACAANNEPNSQPEPMIEVSDAQVAPISPISRRRPTSAGWLAGAPVDPVSVAMIDALFSILPRGACPPRQGGLLACHMSRVRSS